MTRSSHEPEVPAEGTQIGRYVVIGPLGAGASGVVISAFDAELGRKVAIKLLHDRRPHSPRARARLMREAKALARLSHPNVTRVHDLGTFADRVFMAMEQVEGDNLSEWIRKKPRSWKEILKVFLAAGRGLAAAHAAGLVHRDFKPDNVLIGSKGEVRVADFGLVGESDTMGDTDMTASLPPLPELDDPSLSLSTSGPWAGTPAYMSPEQIDGAPVDPRSDQFSYCVALFEALNGERPFEGETVDEIRASIERGRIRSVPTSDAPRAVRNAVEQGLSLHPEDRHASMKPLLSQLQRDPARAWRRAALVGLPAVALGLALASYESEEPDSSYCSDPQERMREVWSPTRASAIGDAFVASDAPYAAETWATVRARVDAFAVEWQASTTNACRGRDATEDTTHADRWIACLYGRLERLRSYADLISNAEEDVVEHAVEALDALGSIPRCRIEGPAEANGPTEGWHSSAPLSRARVLLRAGRYDEAVKTASEAKELAFASGERRSEAKASMLLAEALDEAGDVAAAEDAYHDALSAAMASGDSSMIARCAAALAAITGRHGGRAEEAGRWMAHASGAVEAAFADDDLRADVATARGLVAESRGDHDAAAHAFTESLELKRSRVGNADISLVVAHDNLCSTERRRSHYDEAIRHCERALEIRRRVLGQRHPAVARTLASLCVAQRDKGEHIRAVALCSEAVSIARDNYDESHPELAKPLLSYGSALDAAGRPEDGEAAYEEAAAILERSPEHVDVGSAVEQLGYILLKAGRGPDAIPHLERALAIFELHGVFPARRAALREARAAAISPSEGQEGPPQGPAAVLRPTAPEPR